MGRLKRIKTLITTFFSLSDCGSLFRVLPFGCTLFARVCCVLILASVLLFPLFPPPGTRLGRDTDGALESAEAPVASTRAAARRRAHLGFLGVGAAALCCLGMVVAFHVPVRTELTITPGEYAQNALANGYQVASYPYGSVHDTPVYPHSPDTQAALLKRYQDYTTAITSAQASEAKMRQVVDHYRTLYDSSYKRGFEHGQKYQDSVTPASSYYVLPQAAATLGKSAEAWSAREKLLTRLHYEIVREQSKLATQHAQEKNLLQKHQLMRGTVDTLLRSSAATAKEIQFLRDRYAEQIAGLQAQLTEAQEARQDQHDEWLKKSQFDWERASGLKAKVAEAIATSDYYKDKAHQAKSDQDIFRDRALRTASDAKVAKLQYTGSLKAAIQAHERELEAIASKNVAALKEAAIDEAMRQKDQSAEELAKAKAKLMEAATEAKVQTGIADAARDAAIKAQAQAKDARSKYQTSEVRLPMCLCAYVFLCVCVRMSISD